MSQENTNSVFDIAVIGVGGAGQMAMLRAVLNHLKTVVFLGDSKTTKKSRATWVSDVDNIPGMFDKKRPITATAREVMQFIERHDDLGSFLTPLKMAATAIKKENGVFEISSGLSNSFCHIDCYFSLAALNKRHVSSINLCFFG